MSIPDTALYVESEEQPHANRNTNVIVPILLSVGSGREYGAVVLRPRRHTRASSLPALPVLTVLRFVPNSLLLPDKQLLYLRRELVSRSLASKLIGIFLGIPSSYWSSTV